MTERFTMDNPNDWGFPITDNDTGKVYSCASNQLMKDLCDEINKIVKENEQLKEENKELKENNEFAKLLANHRGEMVSFANALIQDLDDEKIQDMWEKFKDEMYKEWKLKRGIE